MSRPPIETAPIEQLVATYASERHCPTLAWGVIADGDLAATGSVGAVTEHTVYRIASMTKSFSAAATLLLRDEGVLRLDDRIADHAPELRPLDRFDSASITVRDLLAMTSGLPTDDPWADRHLDLTDDELDELIDRGLVFALATGNAFEYSNLGYGLLGRVVLRATGATIQQLISDRLLEPLGMAATTWQQPDHDDWARPLRWLDGDADGAGDYTDELEPLRDGVMAPMGGLWATVADLTTWATWLSDAFPRRDDADDGPLSRSSRRELQSAHRYIGQRTIAGVRSPCMYGFGHVLVDDERHGLTVTHSGGLPGYGSNMCWLPGRGIGVIALANSTYAPMLELSARILDALDDQGRVPPAAVPLAPDLEEIADRLVTLLNDWDDREASALFTHSLVLDDPLAVRAVAARRLIDETGQLSVTSIEAKSAAGADVRCSGSGGRDVTVSFALGPRRPLQIQSYTHDVAPSEASG